MMPAREKDALQEDDSSADLADRMDSALQAVWAGDSSKFERLLGSDAPEGPRLGRLLGALGEEPAPIFDLPGPSAGGEYRIIREIGRGGMGVVYEAEQRDLRRNVALKVLREWCVDERHVKLFRHEMRALAHLNHPGIAAIYDAGQTGDGRHFFTMELVYGAPLHLYLRQNRPSLRQRLELFGRICDAVHYAHENGVIHCDLKPSNILIVEENTPAESREATEPGRREGTEARRRKGEDSQRQEPGTCLPKVLDFGLARMIDTDATVSLTMSQTGPGMGTPAYMSPEQAGGQTEKIDRRTDVYALGVILYELLTGRLPYDLGKGSPCAAARVICEDPPQKPSALDPRLRGDLETIVLKALEKEPGQRYSSAGELAEDIRRHLRGDPPRVRPASRFHVLGRKVRKRPILSASVALMSIAALVALGLGIRGQARTLASARREALHIQRACEVGRAARVLEAARALCDRSPTVTEAWLAYAWAQFKAGQGGDDLTWMGRVLNTLRARIEDDHCPWAFRAVLAEIKPDHPDARPLSESVVPDTAEAWYIRSFATGDLHRAARFAREAVDRDAAHRLAWERLAHLSLHIGDFDGASGAGKQVIALGGDEFEWREFDGHALVRWGRYWEAMLQYASLIRAAQSSAEQSLLYSHRALAHLCLRRYGDAVEDCSTAVRLCPTKGAWLYYRRATPLWIMGELEAAANDYRKFIALRDYVNYYSDARLFFVLREQARELTEQGLSDEADRVLREADQALDAARREPGRKKWPAVILECIAGEIEPSALLDRADSQNMEEVCEAHYYAGEVYLMRGQFANAREQFQKCVNTNLVFDQDEFPPNPMSEYHLAVWRLGWLDNQ